MRLIDDPKGGITPKLSEEELDRLGEEFVSKNPYGVKTFLAHLIISGHAGQFKKTFWDPKISEI